jgi:spermidine/putrescine transport system permease protein
MRRAYLLLTPALLLLLAIAACLALLIVISFWTQDYLDLMPRWSLESYASLLRSPVFSRLMLRSAAISALVTVASLLIAFPMAYVVAFDVAGSKLAWLLVFTLPCWISYLLRILSWKLILGYQGLLNMTLMQLELSDHPLEFLLYNPTSVTIALVQAWAPFALLPIYVSLDKIDRSLLQAAADLGDGWPARPY